MVNSKNMENKKKKLKKLILHRLIKTCLEVLLWLFFKIFFTQKYIKIIFYYYYFKNIFNISVLKLFKNIKNILI